MFRYPLIITQLPLRLTKKLIQPSCSQSLYTFGLKPLLKDFRTIHSTFRQSFSSKANPSIKDTPTQQENAAPANSGDKGPDRKIDYYKNLLAKLNTKKKVVTLTPKENILTLQLLYKVGELYDREKQDALEAFNYYSQMLSYAQEVGISDVLEIADAHNGIAMYHHYHKKDFDKADQHIDKAQEIYSKAVSKGNEAAKTFIAQTRFLKAMNYMQKGSYDKAYDSFQHVLVNINEMPPTEASLCLRVAYDSLGEICKNRNDFPQAIEYYEKAVEVVEQIFGSDSDEVLPHIKKLKEILIQEGKLVKAIKYEEKHLHILLETYGGRSSKVGLELTVLADLCFRNREYQKGLDYYERGITILEKLKKLGEVQVPEHISVAEAYFHIDEYEKADEVLQHAADRLFEIGGGESLQLADYYHYWAELLMTKTGTKANGVKFLKRALEIYNRNIHRDGSIMLMRNLIMGRVSAMEGKNDLALKWFDKSLKLWEKVDRKPKPLEYIYNLIGNIYLKTRRYKESVEAFEKALNASEKTIGITNFEVHYVDLGKAYEASGQLEKAAEVYYKAIGKAIDMYGKEEERTQNLIDAYRNVLTSLKREDEIERFNKELESK